MTVTLCNVVHSPDFDGDVPPVIVSRDAALSDGSSGLRSAARSVSRIVSFFVSVVLPVCAGFFFVESVMICPFKCSAASNAAAFVTNGPSMGTDGCAVSKTYQ